MTRNEKFEQLKKEYDLALVAFQKGLKENLEHFQGCADEKQLDSEIEAVRTWRQDMLVMSTLSVA